MAGGAWRPDYAVGGNGTGTKKAISPTSPAKRHYDDSVDKSECQDGVYQNKNAAT